MTTLNTFFAGQSFAEPFLVANSVSQTALKAAFARFGVTLNIYGYAVGGSSILKANAPASHPTWHWWNEVTNAPGPLLVNAVNYINSLPSGVVLTRGDVLLGEGDSVGPNPDPVAIKDAVPKMMAALRAAMGYNAGFVMQPVGRRIASGAVPGVQIVREAQLDMTNANTPYVYGGDCYDLNLLGDDPLVTGEAGNSHFISPDQAEFAWRMAQRLLQSISIGASPPIFPRMPPLVGAITRSGNDIIVPIAAGWVGGSLIKPANPSHLAIRDASGVIESPDLAFSWSGDVLTITPPRAFGSGHFLTPYGMVHPIDRANLIRDALYRFPLRSTKAAIP